MRKYVDLFKQTIREFGSDKVPRLGAALAYYTIFSIAPLLLIAISIAGLVFGKEAASGQVYGQLRGVLGPASAETIQKMVETAAKPKSSSIATIIGAITLLLGASGVVGQLKDALNTIWDVKPSDKHGIKHMLMTYVVNWAMVLGIGFMLLVSLVIDSVLSAFSSGLWQPVQLVISLAVITALFAAIFRFLPDLKIQWHDVWFGAVFTSVLFVIGKFALGLYLGKSAVGSSYGAAGSLVVVLLWVYYAAQIVLFGAEFTQVYARSHGSLKEEAEAKEPERKEVAGPAVAYPRPVAVKSGGGGGGLKLAFGGIAGLLVGTLVGGFASVMMLLKSVKKLIS
ncbi:MAG TPA: YihY/virulence factor BrkB family protein [Thermoanaerobaculia bacterium]|nr:YihY/virulence factor BrkB family protein [Thermoanaerobaculia bacterium]